MVPNRRDALEKIVLHATRLRIPIVELEGGSLTSLAGFDGHQGVALVVEPRVFATLDDVLARALERGEPPFVLALDSLEDPQNLGTLLRSAEAVGVHGVLFPTRRQAPLTPAAVKASAGAVEHLLLCPVDDLASALADLHVRGLRVAGSEADAPLTARQADLRGPLALVVGSEGQGLGPTVRRRCDLLIRIPMRGAVGSLNAAVAGSVLLFEALAQRDPEGRQPSASTARRASIASASDARLDTAEPAEREATAETETTAEPEANAETETTAEPETTEPKLAEPAAPELAEPAAPELAESAAPDLAEPAAPKPKRRAARAKVRASELTEADSSPSPAEPDADALLPDVTSTKPRRRSPPRSTS